MTHRCTHWKFTHLLYCQIKIASIFFSFMCVLMLTTPVHSKQSSYWTAWLPYFNMMANEVSNKTDRSARFLDSATNFSSNYKLSDFFHFIVFSVLSVGHLIKVDAHKICTVSYCLIKIGVLKNVVIFVAVISVPDIFVFRCKRINDKMFKTAYLVSHRGTK